MNDAEKIAGLEKACFSDFWSEKLIDEQLSLKDTIYIIAERGGKAVGYVLGVAGYDDCELYRIAVYNEYRRQGIAAELVNGFIEECRSRKPRGKVFLEVRESNTAARALYERSGFKHIAERKGYYDTENAEIYEYRHG